MLKYSVYFHVNNIYYTQEDNNYIVTINYLLPKWWCLTDVYFYIKVIIILYCYLNSLLAG